MLLRFIQPSFLPQNLTRHETLQWTDTKPCMLERQSLPSSLPALLPPLGTKIFPEWMGLAPKQPTQGLTLHVHAEGFGSIWLTILSRVFFILMCNFWFPLLSQRSSYLMAFLSAPIPGEPPGAWSSKLTELIWKVTWKISAICLS